MTPKQHLIAAFRALCDAEGGVDEVATTIRASAESLKQVYRGTALPKTGEPRGIGPSIQKKLEAHYPGWSERQHRSAGVAQELSHSPRKIAAQRFSWGDLVRDVDITALGELFVTTLPDDANAPDYPKGIDIVWSTTKPADYGSLVLVRDKRGQLHAREYRQGPDPSRWLAAASNRAFFTFDSRDDGLRVLAVAAFRELP